MDTNVLLTPLLVALTFCPAGGVLAEQSSANAPRVLVDGWSLELVASEPQIVTPVAMTFDDQGRLLVIESHTHFRPEDYDGPQFDRIRALKDSDGDGKLESWSTFYEGSEATMGLAPGPQGSIYVATRGEVFRLRDVYGDGVADERLPIAKLHTKGEYPHNALGGLAYDPRGGQLYIGLGENLGEAYTLTGTDGVQLQGSGEGSVFQCHADGSSLRRLAQGIWNPFALCLSQFNGQQLFAVDNDPDASPPCRLLHIVPGGDYGFRYRYGRAGRIRCKRGTVNFPELCPWFAGLVRPRVPSSGTEMPCG